MYERSPPRGLITMSNIPFLFLPLAFSSLPAVLPFVSPSSQVSQGICKDSFFIVFQGAITSIPFAPLRFCDAIQRSAFCNVIRDTFRGPHDKVCDLCVFLCNVKCLIASKGGIERRPKSQYWQRWDGLLVVSLISFLVCESQGFLQLFLDCSN